MNKIFRTQTIVINQDFQSYWTRLGQPFASWLLWPLSFPLSWAGQTLYSNPVDRGTFRMAYSYKQYKRLIRAYVKRTDDIPTPGDDPRTLRVGVYFPKTRHSIFVRLAELKILGRQKDRDEVSTSENREAMLNQFYVYRNGLTKAHWRAISNVGRQDPH